MKITCQSCQAGYSIPDEKVTGEGRVFSIRCTNCGATITVEGIAATGSTESETGWYYAVGGERQGPVTRDQLLDLVTAGTLEPESYVWRSGMSDWITITDCDELTPSPAGAAPEPEPVSEAAVEAIAAESPEPTFDDSDAGEVAWEEPAPEEPEEDIFSFDTAVSPRAAANEVHARRDTSVLFSLDELAQINESTGPENSEDLLTETSGLIDIRAFAAQEEPSTGDGLGDLFGESPATASVSATPRPAFTGVSVPVMTRRRPKWIWIPIVVLIAGVSVGATILLTGQSNPSADKVAAQKTPPQAGQPQAQAPKPAGTPPAKAQPEATPPKKAAPPKPVPSGQPTAAKTPGNEPAASKKAVAKVPAATPRPPTSKKAKNRGKAKKPDKKKKKKEKKKEVKPKPKPKPKVVVKPPPKKSKSSANVDHLLKMLDKKKKKAASGGGGGSNAGLPQSISSSAISSKIRGRKGRFNKCYKKQANRSASGARLSVSFTIKSSGSVSGVRVSGPVSGAVRGCIAGVIRRIKFKRFRNPTKKVGPLSIRVR